MICPETKTPIFIDMEKRYLVKISFRDAGNLHPEEFEVYDDISNKRLGG